MVNIIDPIGTYLVIALSGLFFMIPTIIKALKGGITD